MKTSQKGARISITTQHKYRYKLKAKTILLFVNYLATYTAILKKKNRNYKLRSQSCLGFAAETSKANDGHHTSYQSPKGRAHTTGVDWNRSMKCCPASSGAVQAKQKPRVVHRNKVHLQVYTCM